MKRLDQPLNFFSDWHLTPQRLERHRIATRKLTYTYAIFFTPRSGSTYLCDLLLKSGVMGRPGEFFNPHILAANLRRFRTRKPVLSLLDYIDLLFIRRRTSNGAWGFKVMQPHFSPYIRTGLSNFIPAKKHIYIFRQNIVRQAVSLYIAEKTRLYHSNMKNFHSARHAASLLPYNEAAIKRNIRSLALQEKRILHYLECLGNNFLQLSYDQIVSQNSDALNRIFEHLGYAPVITIPTNAELQKVSSTTNDDFYCRLLESKGVQEFLINLGLSTNRTVGQ